MYFIAVELNVVRNVLTHSVRLDLDVLNTLCICNTQRTMQSIKTNLKLMFKSTAVEQKPNEFGWFEPDSKTFRCWRGTGTKKVKMPVTETRAITGNFYSGSTSLARMLLLCFPKFLQMYRLVFRKYKHAAAVYSVVQCPFLTPVIAIVWSHFSRPPFLEYRPRNLSSLYYFGWFSKLHWLG